MRKLLILSALFASAAFGQGGSGIPQVLVAPSGACPGGNIAMLIPAGTIYTCQNGTWGALSGGGGGSGTVTTSGSPATNTFSMFTGPTVIGNGPLSTDGTTLTSTEPFSAVALNLSDATHTGYQAFTGVTSGTQVGWTAADSTGTSVLYLLPTATGTGNFLKDNGVVTCPTLPAGAPNVCHGTIWTSAASATGVQLIQLQTVTGSSAASVTFSSLAGYTNIYFKVYGTGTSGDALLNVQFNADTAANYAGQIWSYGTTGSLATGQTSVSCGVVTGVSGALASTSKIEIAGYLSTAFDKQLSCRTDRASQVSGAAGAAIYLFNGWWLNTAAITSVKFTLSAGNFSIGDILAAYGEP